jgi:hypothetical protein
MGILGDAIGKDTARDGRGQGPSTLTMSAAAQPPLGPSSSSAPPALAQGSPSPSPSGTLVTPQDAGRSELRRRRDALAEQVTELHWDLGGLAYEMAIRDHFRLDVLVRRAAVLQERDAELAEIERLLRLEESASAGACPHCSAPHSRGALFCWQCGATLMERSPSSTTTTPESPRSGGEDSTAVMDALLAPGAARGDDATYGRGVDPAPQSELAHDHAPGAAPEYAHDDDDNDNDDSLPPESDWTFGADSDE